MLRYTSSVEPEDLPVAFFVYQEPENDPKNFAYFWVCRDDHISEQKWVGCSEGGRCWAWCVVNMIGDVDGWCGTGGDDKYAAVISCSHRCDWLFSLVNAHCCNWWCSLLWWWWRWWLMLIVIGTCWNKYQSVQCVCVCVLRMVSYVWTGVDVYIVC